MDLLSEAALRAHYETIIRPKFFNPVDPSEKPTSIFLGGQPGSGKSYLKDICKATLPGKNAVVIDTDLLRNEHPSKALISEKEIYNLDKDCYQWGEMLIQDCLREGKNVIFDGTFGGSVEHSHKLMERFKEKGYHVELNLLAANDVVSKIGCSYRYELSKEKTNTGRPVDRQYHDSIYAKVPYNLMSTVDKKLIKTFRIYDRDHATRKLKIVKEYSADQLATRTVDPVKEYVNQRVRPFNENEIEALKSWSIATEKLIEKNKGSVSNYKEQLFSNDVNAKAELRNQILEIRGLSKENIKLLNGFNAKIETIHEKLDLLEKLPNVDSLIKQHNKNLKTLEQNVKGIMDGTFDYQTYKTRQQQFSKTVVGRE
jgi:predicted kinase